MSEQVSIPEVKPWGKGEKMDLQRALEKAGLWIGQAKSFLKTRREFWRKHVKRYDQACDIAWREMEAQYPLEKTVVATPAATVPIVVEPVKEVVAKVAADAPAVLEDVPDADADAGESVPASALASPDLKADTLWAYQNLDLHVKRLDAPSPGAWALLKWARKYQSRFFEQFLQKATKVRDEDADGAEAGEEKSIAEIRRIVGQMSSAEKAG